MTAARRLWQVLEPVHAVVYFAPEARQALAATGLKGFWMGYFAGRAAPLGAVPSDVVIATFYNFHPDMVRRAIPDAWRFATVPAILDARLSGVDAALSRLLGSDVDSEAVARAAALARRAAERASADVAGRPLLAGNAALPWPAHPHLVLWQAATVLREHRGDGHVAALVAAGVSGCEAHVLLAGAGLSTPELQRGARGWSDDEWGAAVSRLAGRGWLDADAALTDSGAAARRDIEERTDALAAGAYAALADDEVAELEELLIPLAVTVAADIPFPNPMGLPQPASRSTT